MSEKFPAGKKKNRSVEKVQQTTWKKCQLSIGTKLLHDKCFH